MRSPSMISAVRPSGTFRRSSYVTERFGGVRPIARPVWHGTRSYRTSRCRDAAGSLDWSFTNEDGLGIARIKAPLVTS